MTLKEGKLNRAVVLDEQQAKAIREWLNAHNKSLIADVSLIMQAAVLRVGDAVALRFDEVINGEIDIEEQKTGKRKALTLPAPVVQMIARRRAEFPHDVHVFRSQRNRSMNKQAPVRREEVSKQIAEAAKAIGIYGTVSAHSFRKAGNALYRRSGNNIALAMTVLNHSNITDTRRYLDLDKQAVSRVINEMDL
ncbi:integrase [Enterobacter hormaechei]|uniref:Integrase n=1 Tax=Enterobacter hormaechei TaxID=158836 RepID=A0A4Y5ZPF2_9ENTR|nr:integrase [Enterobacter hormaechei]